MTREGREIARVLNAAADLIEPEGAWTQDAFSRNKAGERLYYGGNPDAVCWCMTGAIEYVTRDPEAFASPAAEFLAETLPTCSITEYNDAPYRTQAEAVAALRTAAYLQEDEVGRG